MPVEHPAVDRQHAVVGSECPVARAAPHVVDAVVGPDVVGDAVARHVAERAVEVPAALEVDPRRPGEGAGGGASGQGRLGEEEAGQGDQRRGAHRIWIGMGPGNR